MNQACDTLKLYTAEGAVCQARTNASIQALKTYYQQPQAANVNSDEALHAFVALTEGESSNKGKTAEEIVRAIQDTTVYAGIPGNLVLAEIRATRHQLFGRPQVEPIQVHTGEQNQTKTKKSTSSSKTSLQGARRQPIQSQKDQEDPGIIEYLIIFETLTSIENTLFDLLT